MALENLPSTPDAWAPRLGELQVTIDTKPAEPKTWDVEIKEKTRTFSDKA